MRKSIKFIPLLTVVLAGCGQLGEPTAEVLAVNPVTEPQPVYAEVLEVSAKVLNEQQVRQACEQQVVERRREERFGDRDGAVIGAVVGGLLGSQVGSGSGRRAATVAGAVGGAIAGREIDRRHQGGQRYSDVETVCRDVTESVDRPNGFEVRYRTPDGGTATRHVMSRPEGSRIEIGTEPVVVGYDVEWRYQDRAGTTRLAERPDGDRLPLTVLLPPAPVDKGQPEAG